MIRMSTFKRGGVHPHDKKELSKNSPIEVLPMPETLIVAMSQHIGAPAKALKKKGDTVVKGEMIGQAASFVSANVHSPVSGSVVDVRNVRLANGASCEAVVIKADGLAAGKGVVIAQTRDEAEATVRDMLDGGRFGAAGAEVLIEEFLEGEEASVFALCDGEHVALLPAAQDHKRVNDNDEGPNTGGMGAYTPAPIATPDVMTQVRDRVVLPTLAELRKRGIVYKGVLFCGLMIGPKGVNVLEFNCRFGDPETEVVLPSLLGDFAAILLACAEGRLDPAAVQIRSGATVTVVMAAPGYPASYPKGLPITGIAEAETTGCTVFHAGTARKDGQTVTSGGRVLTVTAHGDDLRAAVDAAYAGVAKIHFEGAHFRRDIAAKAFKHLH